MAKTKQYSIAKARDQLTRIVHSVERGSKVELTRRGKRVAVLLSVSDYERMLRKSPDFWEALQEFRESTDLEELEIDPTVIYQNVRDRSPGRKVTF